jgi:serine palmitoyltransferase
MDGTVPRLDRMAALKEQFDFTILADEAHSLLSLGETGRGCIEMWNQDHPEHPIPLNLFDIRTATLSKAIGAIGGIVFGTSRFEKAILSRHDELLRNSSEPLVPAAIVQALYVLGQPSRLQRNLRRLQAIVSFVRAELAEAGIFVYGNALTPVLPIHTGRPSLAAKLSHVLRQQGVLATPIATPAVPMWEARVRVCLSADFNDDTVNSLVGGLIRGCQILGITGKSQRKTKTFTYEDELKHLVEAEVSEIAGSRQYIRGLILQDKNSLSETAKHATRLIQAGHVARDQFGIASGAPRWTAGTYTVHLKVEKAVSELTATEATMTFPDSHIGLMSTIAALSRPLIGFKKHYLFIPGNAPLAVTNGLKIAPRKRAPITKFYDSAESLLQVLKSLFNRDTYITLYVDSDFQSSAPNIHGDIKKLFQSKPRTGMTILLSCHEGPGHVPHMDIVETAKRCGAQLVVYGSFSRSYGLAGAYLAGKKQLIDEFRYTSRGYMFTTSGLPFVMGMILEALRSGKEHP